MLTIKQFTISSMLMIFLSVINIIILLKDIHYPVQLSVLGSLLILANGINVIIIENQAAYIVLNLNIAVILIVSILRIIGWV